VNTDKFHYWTQLKTNEPTKIGHPGRNYSSCLLNIFFPFLDFHVSLHFSSTFAGLVNKVLRMPATLGPGPEDFSCVYLPVLFPTDRKDTVPQSEDEATC
jgi:hypothetical protein